ncbi:hypothetical protein HDC90_004602 [Pedobacter sp. AK013]|uniref:DUF3560 domain-containing protein n=1 Tax=Pedobacter sp. AK013 TaxID=2723071 RepID=UPI00161B0F04|nr:DUF3560 domain-containing protein [Pedobacter sp. AK013]MBB6239940.1 hypothetical protein [Pedobacter sp. AK013]
MKHDFNERKENRINHARALGKKNEKESDQLYHSAADMASVIPMGQPILVGHHSEKRDRRYREKIHDTMGKSVEKQKKAAYYADKAETIASNDAIFSDDPEALSKLKDKLARLQALQNFMKAANRCLRRQNKAAFLMLPSATAEMWGELNDTSRRNFVGFPSYSLTNNNAKIKTVESRIKMLEAIEARAEFDMQIGSVRVWENKEGGRLQMIFEGKPVEEIRRELKRHGFRWSGSQGAWQRHISANALYWAKLIAAKVN